MSCKGGKCSTGSCGCTKCKHKAHAKKDSALVKEYWKLSAELKRQKPDWSKLALWNDLRHRYIGETKSQPIPTATDMPDHG